MSTRYERSLGVGFEGALAILSAFAILSLPACAEIAQGQPVSAPESTSGQRLLNRTLLTVGTDVYTAWDAAALTCAWATVTASPGTPPAVATIDWFAVGGGAGMARSNEPLRLDADVKRFLFLTLVWSESRKLNLFVPPERELEAAERAFQAARSGSHCPTPGESYEARMWLARLPVGRARGYVDLALRGQAFERVRGGLEKNPNLLSQSWFWHAVPSGKGGR